MAKKRTREKILANLIDKEARTEIKTNEVSASPPRETKEDEERDITMELDGLYDLRYL